ncbi:NADPH-dependent FMN reductase [Sciscionella marina]|uniref:NADPH-dependent FMN reductase n=1 Tax=Sciscionella marina TaxID=508770 RepID=UPI0003609D25|nr:NAD(P)H-dependent oxidoreductase [Sciscionella marina]
METYRLAVLIGSVREGRFGPVVARWFAQRAGARPDVEVDLIDLAAGPVLAERIEAADAVVVVTPEYNHAYPGPLKDAIDAVFLPWHAKPVGFVSYGGISGGLRAVEGLRLVFAELHAMTVRDSVSIADVYAQFDADGAPVEPKPLEEAAEVMLDRLAWWAFTLRDGRKTREFS